MKDGWALRPIGEIATLQRGFDLPKRDRTPGEFPLVTSSGVTDTHIEAKVDGPGVATGRSGSIGQVFYVDQSFWPLNTALFVKDFHGNDPRFVYYLFQFVDLQRFASGAGVPTLNRNDVHRERYSIPTSVQEQKRIVAILDEAFERLDRAKANAEANRESAKQLFPAILTEAFEQDRTGWSRKTLAELCEKITDGTHQTPKYYDAGYIFLSSKNVTSGRINWDDIRYIDEVQHLSMQKRLSPRLGDVLLAKNGTTGVAAIVDREVPFDIYVSLALLRAKEEILPEFLLHFTNSSIAKKQFNKRLKGVGVPNLHLKEIREVEMTYPRDLGEQKRLVRYFEQQRSRSEALIESAENKSRELDQLRQSILEKAFAGELT